MKFVRVQGLRFVKFIFMDDISECQQYIRKNVLGQILNIGYVKVIGKTI